MSPPSQQTITISESRATTNSNTLEDLFALLDIVPDEEYVEPPPNAGAPVSWQNMTVGHEYWGQVTGFGTDGAVPRLFTVTEISRFPDGGAMIWTEVAADGVHSASQSSRQWAWGVGASCESLVGPRNRFWCVRQVNQLH